MDFTNMTNRRMTTIATVRCVHCNKSSEHDLATLPVSANRYGFIEVPCAHCGGQIVTHINFAHLEVKFVDDDF